MNEKTLSQGLDWYKYTMGNVIYQKHPDTEVTFTFNNRNLSKGQRFSEFVSPERLQERLSYIREKGLTGEEIIYLAGVTAQDGSSLFTQGYLDHLAELRLPEVSVTLDSSTNELAISACDKWVDVSPLETVIMSELNEEYYEHMMERQGLSINDVYDEADERLSEKINVLKHRPDIQFADFGTRRRFSSRWHNHVIGRLAEELPDNFIGTSNPWFAYKYNLTPIGTFAHEMPMVYAGIEDAKSGDPLIGHEKMLRDWEGCYNGDLSIALTDTFGTDFFFDSFTPQQAKSWKGLRHDSGDPIAFGERAIEFYAQHGIDPRTKTTLFSDSLNVPTMVSIADHFNDRIRHAYGIGSNLMNDMHPKLPSTNFVIKATAANGTPTVKLSDDKGKHTGPAEKVARYQQEVARRHALARAGFRTTLAI